MKEFTDPEFFEELQAQGLKIRNDFPYWEALKKNVIGRIKTTKLVLEDFEQELHYIENAIRVIKYLKAMNEKADAKDLLIKQRNALFATDRSSDRRIK